MKRIVFCVLAAMTIAGIYCFAASPAKPEVMGSNPIVGFFARLLAQKP